jgi:hypothetical protein
MQFMGSLADSGVAIRKVEETDLRVSCIDNIHRPYKDGSFVTANNRSTDREESSELFY